MNERLSVLLWDSKTDNPNRHIVGGVARALQRHPRVARVTLARTPTVVRTARVARPDLFLAIGGEELDGELVRRSLQFARRSAVWFTEDPFETSVNVRLAGLFEHVFTTDSECVAAYGPRATHLPLAGDVDRHLRPPLTAAQEFDHDVLFVGSAWPERVRFLVSLRQRLGSSTAMHVRLPIPQPLGSDFGAPPSWIAPSRLSNRRMIELARRSRIVLVLHRQFSLRHGCARPHTPGPRVFEIALAGAFQLADGSLPGLAGTFTPDKEIALFNDADHCAARIEHFLQHPMERVHIAGAARARALAEHTYDTRVGAVLGAAGRASAEHVAPRATPRVHRSRVLFVSHSTSATGRTGGVELYQDVLRGSLRSRFEFFVYAPVSPGDPSCYELRDGNLQTLAVNRLGPPAHDDLWADPAREQAFADVLTRYGIDVVHFHHLLGHPLALPRTSARLGTASVLSFQDYYLLCQSITLLGSDGRYCAIDQRPATTCDRCLRLLVGAPAGAQRRRQEFIARVIDDVDCVHFNTPDSYTRFHRFYPRLRSRRALIRGLPPASEFATPAPASQRGPFRVAVPGNVTYAKGAETLLEVIEALSDEPFEFTLLGRVDAEYVAAFTAFPRGRVVVVGGHAPARTHDLLVGHHASLHLSIWPETYCIALTDAWQAGLVPIVTELGALGERVRDGRDGLVTRPQDAAAVTERLRELAACPALREHLHLGARRASRERLAEHLTAIAQEYETLARSASTG